jgi:hypothetical protein
MVAAAHDARQTPYKHKAIIGRFAARGKSK